MQFTTIRWPKNAQAAVSLTYDDGITNHYQVVAPQLVAHGLRGTFYAPIKSDLIQTPLAWRKLAARGHELGNHTIFHPCWSVNGKYADWLPDAHNLEQYTEAKWLDEINTANRSLRLVDGRSERTFGNTCFDNYLGPASEPICLEPLIARTFLAARGEDTGKPVNLQELNFNNLGTIWADRRSFGDFVPEMEDLIHHGGWIIYTMHGVGEGSHRHCIDAGEHLRLLDFLHANANRIWTAPVIDVVRHLKKAGSA
jgi:peptidoglycan-N-acetylglucosamine deacetylase